MSDTTEAIEQVTSLSDYISKGQAQNVGVN